MNLPPLTVLIPVYNGANFLAKTLLSVLAQTYAAVEILVIDDGSTDASAEIAESFGERIRLIRRPNSGVSASRNCGLSIASTDWVALVDHDDVWEPNHLENLATAIAAEPEADLCYSGARRLIAVDGVFRATEQLVFPSPQEVNEALMDRCAFITSSVALRRSSALAVGGFDSYFLNLQDWDLWLRLMHRGSRFIHAPSPTLLYRVHPESRTNRPLRALKFSKEVVRRNILPHLSTFGRLTRGPRVLSRLEAEAAILLRQNGMNGAESLLWKSIARYPFHEPRRYKILAHMLLHGYPRVTRSTDTSWKISE